MKYYADLHLHTDCSDGVLSPEELIDRAIKIKGVGVVSLTDHDTFSGIDRAFKAAGNELEVVPGVELSTEVDGDGRELHILGYYVDYKNSPLVKKMEEFREARVNRAKKIVENLNQMKVMISYDDVIAFAGDAAVGRPHIARAIMKGGYVENSWEAFDRYLGDESPAYVPKFKITPAEAIKLIKDSGGIAIWAHPRVSRCEDLIEGLVKAGLDGLESYHPKHPEEDTLYLNELISRYGLIATGGSDFHDDDRGKDIGDCGVSEEHFLALKKRANRLEKK